MEIHPAILAALPDAEVDFPTLEFHPSILDGEIIEEDGVPITKSKHYTTDDRPIPADVDSSASRTPTPDTHHDTATSEDDSTQQSHRDKEVDVTSHHFPDAEEEAKIKSLCHFWACFGVMRNGRSAAGDVSYAREVS
jgi:hypothetical protein